MFESQSVATDNDTLSWSQKWSRHLFCQIMKGLPEGQLVIQEQGRPFATFGEANSDLKAHINIHHPSTYARFLFGGSVGAGEAYVDGSWDSPDVTKVVQLFARNLPMLDSLERKFTWFVEPFRQVQHWRNRNTHQQAKKNISAHYDLGNELYREFLDPTMMYSSAIYPSKDATLEEAQNHKLATICEKLQLNETDHLLEIGTGWGGLAIFAAQHYGCKVTTTTISDEQHRYAEEKIKALNLEHKITLLKQDYRTLTGQFDKLVSIEMIEAVGKSFLGEFFKQCSARLKKNGLMLLQAITINDQRYDSYAKGVDFIQKHIFPGGFLPSHLAINQYVKSHTDMMIRDSHDIGLDYARTLKDWHHKLNQNQRILNSKGYDERFMRLWRYYFAYCEGGFLERTISTVQLVMSKPHYRHALFRSN